MIFYDTVVKTIIDAVKEKTKEATAKLNSRILAIENTNLLFATKKEVEKRIGEVYDMIGKEKSSILEVIEKKVAGVASMDSVVSLAKGINDRLDNMYYALEVTKNQAVNQATEIVSGALSQLSQSIASNSSEIAKNREETTQLKTLVDTLLPQIVHTLDTTSLTAIIDSLVQVELNAIENRLKTEIEQSIPTEQNIADNLAGIMDVAGNSTQDAPISAGNVQSNSGSVEEEIPLQG